MTHSFPIERSAQLKRNVDYLEALLDSTADQRITDSF